MSWQLTYHVLPQAGAVAICLFLAVVIWKNRESRGSVALLITLVGVTGWSATYALQIASVDLSAKVFWNDFRFLFLLVAVLGYFSFAARYTSRDRWLRQPALIVLVVPAAITLALVFTNGAHEWVRTGVTTTAIGETDILEYDWGPWFYVHLAYAYTLMGTAIIWIVSFARQNWTIYRDQAIVIVVAALIPWLLSVLYALGIMTIEYTTFGLSISAVAFAWAMYRYDLLDLIPIARKHVVEEMRDGVVILDIEDRIVDLNEASEPILTATEHSDALGSNVVSALAATPPTDRDRPRQVADGDGTYASTGGVEIPVTAPETDLETFVDDGVEIVVDTSLEELFDRDPLESVATDVTCSVDGSTRYYVLSLSPLCDESGQLTGRLVVAEDVTAIKRREHELKTATEALEKRTRQLELRNREQATLIENLPGTVYRCTDVESDGALFVSTGARALTGYDSETFESGTVTLQSIVYPDDRETAIQQKSMAVEDGTRFDVTYRVVTNEGTHRWVRDIGEGVYDKHGDLEFIEGFILDVTENKQREQLQVLTRVLRHNIRNEMNVISGRLDLALAQATPATRDHLEVVERASHRVTRLGRKAREIQDLLGTDDAPEIERIDVIETIDRAVSTLIDDHPDEVTIETKLPDRLEVYGNELLATAVYELLENAVVHTDHVHTQITVSVRSFDDERVEIQIVDNGPGIPDAELEALNGRMESPLVHGSGLGLWVVRWIVDAYGELEISSGSCESGDSSGFDESSESDETRGSGTTASIRLRGVTEGESEAGQSADSGR